MDQAKTSITVAAIGCASAVGVAAYLIMDEYYKRQPVWVEQAAYLQWQSLNILSVAEQQGRVSAALEVFRGRHILQPLVLTLLAPELLGWPHAHLVFVLPAFAIFLGLFGWTVYQRVKNVLYGVAAVLLYSALRGLLNERWGIGTGFADYQSSFLLGAGTLCLIQALKEPGLGWIRAFAIFVSLSVLARTTAAFMAAIICGPILLIYLASQYREAHSLKPSLIALANILVIVAPAAAIVVWQLPSLLWYYGSSNAWALGGNLIESARAISSMMLQFLGIPAAVICVILFALGVPSQKILTSQVYERALALVRRTLALIGLIAIVISVTSDWLGGYPGFGRGQVVLLIAGIGLLVASYTVHVGLVATWLRSLLWYIQVEGGWTLLALGWWAVGLPAFLWLYGYVSYDAPKEVMYAVPGLLLAAMWPFGFPRANSRLQRPIVFGMIFFAVSSFAWNFVDSVRAASYVSPRAAAERQSQLKMAEVLASLPSGTVWQSYTVRDWGIPVSLLVYYEYGKFARAQNSFFHNRKSYWDAYYPGLSLPDLQEKLYAQTVACIDAAVVLGNSMDKPEGMEEYSYALAAYISERVQSDRRWGYYRNLSGQHFGAELAIFLNHGRQKSGCL